MNRVCKFLPVMMVAIPLLGHAESGFYFGGGFGGSRIEQDIGLTVTIFTDSNVPRPPDPDIFVDELAGTDAAFKVFGGYQFGKYIAIEGGYVDLGEAESSVPFTIPFISTPFLPPPAGLPNGCPAGDPSMGIPADPDCFRSFQRGDQDRTIEVKNQIDGWVASLVGIWPLAERVDIFGKVGILSWDSTRIIEDRVATTIPVDQPSVPAIRIPGVPLGADGAAAIRIDETDGTDLALGAGANFKVTDHTIIRGEFEWFDISDTDLVWTAGFSLIVKF